MRRQTQTILLEIRARFALLTTRERQVMLEIIKGRLNKQIAAKFRISEFTVKVHRAHLMHKMKAKTLVQIWCGWLTNCRHKAMWASAIGAGRNQIRIWFSCGLAGVWSGRWLLVI